MLADRCPRRELPPPELANDETDALLMLFLVNIKAAAGLALPWLLLGDFMLNFERDPDVLFRIRPDSAPDVLFRFRPDSAPDGLLRVRSDHVPDVLFRLRACAARAGAFILSLEPEVEFSGTAPRGPRPSAGPDDARRKSCIDDTRMPIAPLSSAVTIWDSISLVTSAEYRPLA